MKILMLGWELPPHNSGGLGVACYHLAKALADTGAEIDFVLPYSADHSDITFMNVLSATDELPDQSSGLGAYDSNYASPGSKVRQVQKQYTTFTKKIIKQNNYDAVHAHDWLTMEAGIALKKTSGVPLVVHVHATEFDRAGGRYGNQMIHDIEYHGLMLADRIIAVSNLTKQVIVSNYHIPEDKVEVVHNAFDAKSLPDFYQYEAETYAYLESLKSEGYTIISAVTRLTLQKGLDYLLEAFALAVDKYDRLALLLVGDGEQRDQLIEQAAKLGIADKIFFTGFIRGQKWRDSYSISDAFVLSSVSEPFGLSALEAAHHNNALILTKQSGVSEVLNSVLRYDFWDVERLADQMVGVASSPVLKHSLQNDVSKEYTNISWDSVAKKCMSLYGRVRSLVI